ncbi:hypothetical protein MA9V2_095 [Chryseobacterium phage MA9V-2]|nr:hypothetical protein MA9V2_095 [Chryseobacterium phage MA9V-2]
MTKQEYDKNHGFFKSHDSEITKLCNEASVNYNYFIANFTNQMSKYAKLNIMLANIERCDFDDNMSTKAILNKAIVCSKESELANTTDQLNLVRSKIFDFLDGITAECVYKIIMLPIFDYGFIFSARKYGYKKSKYNGIVNLDLAMEYAKYRLSKSL